MSKEIKIIEVGMVLVCELNGGKTFIFFFKILIFKLTLGFTTCAIL